MAIPMQGMKRIPPIQWNGVPEQFKGKVSAVCWTLRDCEELVKWFGDATFAPFLPVLVNAPGGWAVIAGLGYADAAELQDCAIVLWNERVEKLKKQQGRIFDFDTLREKAGLARKEHAAQAISEAIMARVAKHKANPRTDPFRQMKYPNPTQRVLFSVDGTRDGFNTETENVTDDHGREGNNGRTHGTGTGSKVQGEAGRGPV